MDESRKAPASSSSKKFLFDIHVFDEEGKDLNAVPDIPPPPSFSESELSQAKSDSFSHGKKEGIAEATASREQFISRLLENISAHFETLFAAEHMREKEYEQESVRLALVILHKIFPVLNERVGTDELKKVILDILQESAGHGVIEIEVAEDCAEEIRALLARRWPEGEKGPAYIVKGRAELKSGACRMAWADGGAVRNPPLMAEKMKEQILALLPAEAIPLEITDIPGGLSPEKHDITESINPLEAGDRT